ncbi:MAG: aldehyde dehydrogenase (NADP(+)) [Planctomycetales bacterium]|nr:aldehyde dehydrogenase (NADP(+)) [Planctomycetales bacterium]MCA9167251.1 aldehyde dehydrogenase (NADP(+)) [Planctomycetales bacterium]
MAPQVHPVLIDGQWRPAEAKATFQACNPATRKWLPDEYPVSTWADCDAALDAAALAATELRRLPPEQIAAFLETYAARMLDRQAELIDMAHDETALPKSPRLADAELPRTVNQLKQAATAAREGSWRMATIDTQNGIRSYYAALGPVCVFGPNNFPFAFNSVAGGDFAAAIAAGNPVIGKANSSHPGTTRLFAEIALQAIEETQMPRATVQLLYRTAHEDGEHLVSDARVGATGYTGARLAGLKLKGAADAAGKPIYVELSSVNPVIILPGAVKERADELVAELTTSALMGTGQFCTNPGMIVLLAGAETESLIAELATRYQQAAVGTLLSAGVQTSLVESIEVLEHSGAQRLTGGPLPEPQDRFCCGNTLLRTTAAEFLSHPHVLQTEAFGNCTLLVVAESVEQIHQLIPTLEGNLTGCIYSDRNGTDDAAYDLLAPELRQRVGRLLNDKMPTGVAVSPAMNHGGPFPATGHPGFTAVGIPASLVRFAMLQCYDNVRPHRLPPELRNANPNGTMWRSIDGVWTQASVS